MVANTIPHAVLESAAREGDHIAIRGEDGREIRYSELPELIERAAAGIIAHGIAPGDRVAIWAPNSAGWIIAALGIQTAGAILVPINTRLKGAEAGYILRKSGARLLLTVESFLDNDYRAMIAGEDLPVLDTVRLLDATAGTIDPPSGPPDAAAHEEARRRLEALGGDDLSDVIFTSGTTGKPKGVMTTHRQNVALCSTYAENLGLGRADVYLIVNPFFHAFGYKAGWFTALLVGATALPQASFDPRAVLARIEAERVTMLPGPPTLYQGLLASDWRDHELSSLRLAITGAASVPVSLIEEMRRELGFETVLTAYGLTENCGFVSMCRRGDPIETIARTAGRPLPGVEVRLVDTEGTPVPAGEPGHLYVRGVGVMRGYLGDPDATARAIDSDGWLKTGDIAVIDGDGNISITDRSDDMFTVGGFNAYPAEIEGLIAAHPAVRQVAVIGTPDARLGMVPHAFVVLRPGMAETPGGLIAWCRANMANYKAPRSIGIVDALPQTASGKVQKYLLREEARQRAEA
jgi:HIP---CoA ligase